MARDVRFKPTFKLHTKYEKYEERIAFHDIYHRSS